MRELASEIYEAVRNGTLRQPFNAAAVREACPGWADHTYGVFLPKHAVGNGHTTELFIRVGEGLYEIISSK